MPLKRKIGITATAACIAVGVLGASPARADAPSATLGQTITPACAYGNFYSWSGFGSLRVDVTAHRVVTMDGAPLFEQIVNGNAATGSFGVLLQFQPSATPHTYDAVGFLTRDKNGATIDRSVRTDSDTGNCVPSF
jgi:hypothetical protein